MSDAPAAGDFPPELCALVERCLANEAVAGVTRGHGTTNSVDVAGTSRRRELVLSIAQSYQEAVAPACLIRDPANPYDPNAVRVYVDGHHVGYLKARDGPRWQPCLLDCERRNLVLCAKAMFYGPSRWGIELLVKREPPRSAAEKIAAQVAARDAVRRDIDKITATRLSGAAQKYGLKVSKRGRECHLLPGKPYGHGTRPPLVGWKGRVFALEELDDFFADFEAEHAASYGFEVDS